jgi:gliding motility-associated-like protein
MIKPRSLYPMKNAWGKVLIALQLICFSGLAAQTPFTCDGTVYGIIQTTNQFGQLVINPSNGSADMVPISSMGNVEIYALGYRITDNLIYGVGRNDQRLYQIDALGTVVDLGGVALNPAYNYDAGDIDNTGQFFYTTGSLNGVDQHLARIDLTDRSVALLPVAGGVNLQDMAFHPYTNRLWGYDYNNRSFLSINLNPLTYTGYNVTLAENEIQACYFNASGQLYGFGRSAFGVAGAIFSISNDFGIETRRSTGPVAFVTDLAGCPYGLDLKAKGFPRILFPCEEVTYTYYVGNGAGQNLTNLDFEYDFPTGFNIQSVLRNPYGGTVTGVGSDLLRITNMTVDSGLDSIIVRILLGDLPGGRYQSQGRITNLPTSMGSQRRTDDFFTFTPADSTYIDINRIDEDSIFVNRFSCLGNTVNIDASEYGANILWNTGSTAPILTVAEEGLYYLNVNSGCQDVYVEFDVSFASCPYTLEMRHQMVPQEVLPCSEVLYRYYIENSSGLPRRNITFSNTLPAGVSLLGVVNNPFGGNLVNDPDPQVVRIANMTLPLGTDTLEILLEVGDLPPGPYPNQARMEGFPRALGPFRVSDDPLTQRVDSTIMTVLGVPTDSFYVDQIICARAELDLNAAPYGRNFLWEGGSQDSILTIIEPGNYAVTILDGCEPSYVFFNVREGTPINLTVEDQVTVFLGESHQFSPLVNNQSDSLLVSWVAAVDSTLSCLDCLAATARSLTTTTYILKVANEECTDSTAINFIVDNTRRVYAPNVFSANRDGVNDYFFLQSPDFGRIRMLRVYNRWGSVLFSSTNSEMNFTSSGWNGRADNTGKLLEPGVYLWQAEIEFLDGLVETFSGDVLLLR